MSFPVATAAEVVSAIQREGLLNAGLPPVSAALQNHSGELARFRSLESEKATGDLYPDAQFAKYRDMSGLLARIPTVYQNPFVYAWLEDFWAHHSAAVYRQADQPPPRFLMASAATGQFNANAISGSDQSAILIEDGLIFFAHRAAYIVSPLLFRRIDGNRFVATGLPEDLGPSSPLYLASLEVAQLVLDYLLEGAVPGVPPIARTEADDFSIRHVIFTSLMSFVFEHELHHLREAREAGQEISIRKKVAQERFDALWRFVEKAFEGESRVEFDQVRMERLFHAHSEEHFADLRALLSVIHIGRESGTLVPAIDGALLFFFLADALNHAHRTIADPEAYRAMDGMNDVGLVLNGLVLEESHPYAHMRLKSLLENQEAFSPSLLNLLAQEAGKLKGFFDTVKEILTKAIEEHEFQIGDLHPKWCFDARRLLGLDPA